MDRRHRNMSILILLLYILLSAFIVCNAETIRFNPTKIPSKDNPFTAKASLIRYWNRHISSDNNNNNLPNHPPPPPFLLSKSSPLTAVDTAILTKLATQNALSAHLDSFCSSANLYCLFDNDATSSLTSNTGSKRDQVDANFASYSNKRFANYGVDRLGGVDSFKNYSDGMNSADDSFTRYSRDSTGHNEEFTNYAPDGNVATGSFVNYASDATGGSGEFINYDRMVNVPHLRFTTYDSDGNDHKLDFSSYSEDTNSGDQGFTSYGKNGNGVPTEFTNYAANSNIIGSTFTSYGETGNGANDTFKGYSESANNPHNNFKNYGNGGNSAIDSFTNYRDGANVGDDAFQSYGKDSNSEKASFANYGKSFNEGVDTFKEYGKGSKGQSTGFKIYGMNTTFKAYSDEGVTFSQYTNTTSSSIQANSNISGSFVNKLIEPGKFFRESVLKEGNVMIMPDIRDKMPERSFLPRSILSELPFSTSKLAELKEIFHARENSSMERVIINALTECERAPSRDETKRCVGSVEDMLDFAISVLGHNILVRTTRNVNGSKRNVMIGEVRGINGGEVTKSVSCHQSLYPYLLYYCHSVPKVRVYEVDILDVESKVEINHGVAICHIDTSAWSQGHGAFVALGSSPGLVEVCHWIFENDMTWTIVD